MLLYDYCYGNVVKVYSGESFRGNILWDFRIEGAEGVRQRPLPISQAKGQSTNVLIPVLFGRNQSTKGRHKKVTGGEGIC